MIDLVNNEYQVFDDLVDVDTQNTIENILFSNAFPWFYNELSVGESEHYTKYNHEYYDYIQMSHVFVRDGVGNSNYCKKILDRLLQSTKIQSPVIRCKANLKFTAPNGNLDSHNKPHYDQEEDHYVGLYYVNDSDGDTWLFDKDEKVKVRVSPKKGRWLFFRGNLLHAASHPIKKWKRLIINIDFKQ